MSDLSGKDRMDRELDGIVDEVRAAMAHRDAVHTDPEPAPGAAVSPEPDLEIGNKMTLPDSHRRGLPGRAAGLILRKLYTVTDVFLSGVFRHQEGINRELYRDLAKGRETLRRLEEDLVRARERMDEVSRWVDMTRSDFYGEMKMRLDSGPGKPGEERGASPPSRIVNAERVESLRPLKLNVGCGNVTREDHINVDLRELDGVDVTAPADDMPFEPGSVDRILAAHLVEHFEEFTLKRRVLPHWHALLRDGGVLTVVVPDMAALLARYAEGGVEWSRLREVTYGGQDYEGNYHFNMFDFPYLKDLLTEAGFRDTTLVAEGRENGLAFEMEVTAIK